MGRNASPARTIVLAGALLLGAASGAMQLAGGGAHHAVPAAAQTEVTAVTHSTARNGGQVLLAYRAQLLGVASRYNRKMSQERKARLARKRKEQEIQEAGSIAAQEQPPAQRAPVLTVPAPVSPPAAGTFSFAELEAIWVREGGSPETEQVAACIATHESGGRPDAISPTDDFGLWQIHGDPAALNPAVSASVAISMSEDGTDWDAWTTAPDCGA